MKKNYRENYVFVEIYTSCIQIQFQVCLTVGSDIPTG